MALGMINDTRAVDPLIEPIHGDESKTRCLSAIFLATIGEPSTDRLIQALGDNDSNTRQLALEPWDGNFARDYQYHHLSIKG